MSKLADDTKRLSQESLMPLERIERRSSLRNDHDPCGTRDKAPKKLCTSKVNVWHIYGISMVCLWCIYGISVVYSIL